MFEVKGMGRFRGTDPVVVLVNELHETRESIIQYLFHEDVKPSFDELVESAGFEFRIRSEYERHYRTSHCHPVSQKDEISTVSLSEPTDSVEPSRPDEGEFETTNKTYPRAGTTRTIDCEYCTTGSPTCPNCDGETRVTCPDCHTPRSGDCKACQGGGEVTCPECEGDRDCTDCGGSGEETCRGCDGTGTVEETTLVDTTCPDCLGRDDQCGRCGGSGEIQERVSESVTHTACRGSGTQPCGQCGGSGACPNCDATGTVTCDDCYGSGDCQTCLGDGTRQCPTCSGDGQVTCPVCDGEASVFLYTTDDYEYEPMLDEDETIPSAFDSFYEETTFSTDHVIELPVLSEGAVRSHFGLFNEDIADVLERARTTLESLWTTTEDRTFNSDIVGDEDITRQKSLLSDIVTNLRTDWRGQPSDDYHAEYRLSVTDRSEEHPDRYRRLLFRETERRLLPLTLVSVSMGDVTERVFSGGTREASKIERPAVPYSVPKVSLFLGVVLFTVLALYGTTTGLSLTVQSATVPASGLLGLLAAGCLVPYGYFVWQSVTNDADDIVLLVGDDDATVRKYLSVLAHSVSLAGRGVVRDEVYTLLTETLFEDVTLGTSLTLAIDFEDGESLRLVGLSGASRDKHDGQVETLVEHSTGVVGLVGSTDADAEAVVAEFVNAAGLPSALVTVPDFDGVQSVDCPTHELPLDTLADDYVAGDGESDLSLLNPIEDVR